MGCYYNTSIYMTLNIGNYRLNVFNIENKIIEKENVNFMVGELAMFVSFFPLSRLCKGFRIEKKTTTTFFSYIKWWVIRKSDEKFSRAPGGW